MYRLRITLEDCCVLPLIAPRNVLSCFFFSTDINRINRQREGKDELKPQAIIMGSCRRQVQKIPSFFFFFFHYVYNSRQFSLSFALLFSFPTVYGSVIVNLFVSLSLCMAIRRHIYCWRTNARLLKWPGYLDAASGINKSVQRNVAAISVKFLDGEIVKTLVAFRSLLQ